jgi:K+-transporting ATPase ATPase C chain
MLLQSLRISVALFAGFTLILGFAYPGLVTGLSQLAFPKQAEGSLIVQGDRIAGSALIGQSFSDPRYFWGRLSATGPVPYNAAASSGSNLGVNAPNLEAAVKARAEALKAADPQNTLPIPVDLVTASGSGLDPHISPEAALYQAERVARARNIDSQSVKNLIAAHTEDRQFGFLGQPRVHVLKLNLALDGADSQ